MNTAFPATSRPQTKRFKPVNTLVLPGQAETLMTSSPTFPFLGVTDYGPAFNQGARECGICGMSQIPCGLHSVFIWSRDGSLGTC